MLVASRELNWSNFLMPLLKWIFGITLVRWLAGLGCILLCRFWVMKFFPERFNKLILWLGCVHLSSKLGTGYKFFFCTYPGKLDAFKKIHLVFGLLNKGVIFCWRFVVEVMWLDFIHVLINCKSSLRSLSKNSLHREIWQEKIFYDEWIYE